MTKQSVNDDSTNLTQYSLFSVFSELKSYKLLLSHWRISLLFTIFAAFAYAIYNTTSENNGFEGLLEYRFLTAIFLALGSYIGQYCYFYINMQVQQLTVIQQHISMLKRFQLFNQAFARAFIQVPYHLGAVLLNIIGFVVVFVGVFDLTGLLTSYGTNHTEHLIAQVLPYLSLIFTGLFCLPVASYLLSKKCYKLSTSIGKFLAFNLRAIPGYLVNIILFLLIYFGSLLILNTTEPTWEFSYIILLVFFPIIFYTYYNFLLVAVQDSFATELGASHETISEF